MTLGAAIGSYTNDLQEQHYSAGEIGRKQTLLRRWLSYAVALHHPGLPSRLLKMTQIRLYSRGVVGIARTTERQVAVAEFLRWWRTAEVNVKHVALATVVDQYQRDQLADFADEARRRRAVDDLCRGLGLELSLSRMSGNTYRQVLGWLQAHRITRAVTYSAAFFAYCGEQGWLSFQPPSRAVREPHQRVFDADYLGTDGGLWSERLRRYLEYLKSERNLSDGGIDYYVRKLKLFVEWLNASAVTEPITMPAIKRFLSEKHRKGCKLRTVAKYLYALRYFFEFLREKGIVDHNPALELSQRADPPEPQETLTQLEVVQLIEFLEERQKMSRDALEVTVRSAHFRAVRDRCLVLLLVLTGVRAGEVCGMGLADIDFAKRSIQITAKGNRSHRHKQRPRRLPSSAHRSRPGAAVDHLAPDTGDGSRTAQDHHPAGARSGHREGDLPASAAGNLHLAVRQERSRSLLSQDAVGPSFDTHHHGSLYPPQRGGAACRLETNQSSRGARR